MYIGNSILVFLGLSGITVWDYFMNDVRVEFWPMMILYFYTNIIAAVGAVIAAIGASIVSWNKEPTDTNL